MKKKLRKRILSVTKKDFTIQTFRAGGKGGQHQNKTESGVRIIHRDSGARGESREHRSQKRNREAAFSRLVLTDKFRTWLRLETAKILTDEHEMERRANRDVERMMVPRNLRVEVRRDGRWIRPDAPKE